MKLSVIIATYNSCETLEFAIDSILSQANPESEIIVVDGGSYDHTVSLLKSYGNLLTGWISENDQGIYDAWNKGLQLATGTWIAFIGADDYYMPESFAVYFDFIERNPDLEYISSKVRLVKGTNKSRIIGEKWSWSRFKRHMRIAHVGSFHHRSLFESYGLFDSSFKSSGDYEFLFRIGPALKAGYIEKVTAVMTSGGTSQNSVIGMQETLKFKQSSGLIHPLIAYYDYLIALMIWHARQCRFPRVTSFAAGMFAYK